MSLTWVSQVTRDEQSAYEYLKQQHCIRRTAPDCIHCNRSMTLVKTGRGDAFTWRCPSHKNYKLSPRSGSFWSSSKLPFCTIIQLAFCWAHDIRNKTGIELTELTDKTVTQWFQYFRDVCTHKLLQNPIQIGGPNVVVELDESLMAKRKNNMGHVVSNRWVFGGICPTTQEGFLVFVERRDAATLLPLIEQHVLPGSIIHTDEWAAYNGIHRINVQPPYTHQTVNHTVNFVDPVTQACTNHVENMWKKAKQKFKAMCGVNDDMLESYLDEFMWRERYGPTGATALQNLFLHISQWYPTP